MEKIRTVLRLNPNAVAVIKNGPARAYFIAWVTETAIGTLLFALLFGNIAMPQILAVVTSGWDTYSIIIWGVVPLICIAGFIVRVIRSAQSGFVGPVSGY